jgi:hypothetical protein
MKCATSCPKQLFLNDSFVMTLRLLIILVLYDYNTSHKLNHIFEDFF